jgi:hypothetical protein
MEPKDITKVAPSRLTNLSQTDLLTRLPLPSILVTPGYSDAASDVKLVAHKEAKDTVLLTQLHKLLQAADTSAL